MSRSPFGDDRTPTASLPPIPEEAARAMVRKSEPLVEELILADRSLTAAWPVIVPAILRWAADSIADPSTLCDRYAINPGAGGANFVAACRVELRSLADEVEGQ